MPGFSRPRNSKKTGKSSNRKRRGSTKRAAGGSRGRVSKSSRKRPTKTAPRRTVARGKVGSSGTAAKAFGGRKDFGAAESDLAEREYVSQNARRRDRGADIEHARGESERTSGVGANESGPGSGSGGDLDPDYIGVGEAGTGISASGGADRTQGPDMTEGSPNTFASGPPSRGKSRIDPKRRERVRGTTFDRSGSDESTVAPQGAASVNSPRARDEYGDSFRGEISADEAAGADNSPSDNR